MRLNWREGVANLLDRSAREKYRTGVECQFIATVPLLISLGTESQQCKELMIKSWLTHSCLKKYSEGKSERFECLIFV